MKKNAILALLFAEVLTACDTENNLPSGELSWGGDIPGMSGSDDGDMPDFDTTIYPYQGQTATDADKDIVSTDADIYWEANTFKNKVTVAYSGNKATVETNNQDIRYE